MKAETAAQAMQAASAAGAAAAIAYSPDALVVACSIIGGALSVWAQATADSLSRRAAVALFGQFGISVAVGISGPAYMEAFGQQFSMLTALASLPHWTQALTMSGCSQFFLTWAAGLMPKGAANAAR